METSLFAWARPGHANPSETRFGRLKRLDAIAVKEPLAGGFDGILRNFFGGSIEVGGVRWNVCWQGSIEPFQGSMEFF